MVFGAALPNSQYAGQLCTCDDTPLPVKVLLESLVCRITRTVPKVICIFALSV